MITTNPIENSSETFKKSATLHERDMALASHRVEVNIDELFAKVTHLITNSRQELTEEVQEEIAKVSILLQKVKKLSSSHRSSKNEQKQSEIKALLNNLDLTIQSLQTSETITIAKKLRINAEFTIRKSENRFTAGLMNVWEYFRLKSSISFKILLGLILAFPLYIGTPLALYSGANRLEEVLINKEIVIEDESARYNESPDLYKKDYDMMMALATLCFIGGSTGSIISILFRLSNYRESQDQSKLRESLTPILVGLCKPMIGGTFGLLIYALLAGGIIPLQVGHMSAEKRQDLRWLSLYSIAFVVGFSERLAKDIVANTENQFKPQDSDNVNTLVSTKSEPIIDDIF
ncbi:hypothetical protein [Crocosphaera sp.]|uniref:hypothetical protein n=1 Tax=Crocosphaera sp. TaxID=2729996 RepID=UPI00261764CE|nr:hypothetical protein [Crocosphaera sp.]MDJ0580944.1 hypothetical protein [Crocosphaera sp.]